MEDQTSRSLRLLALLQTGRPWSGAELARRLGVSARTVRRDVDRLRRLGYRVDADPGPGGSYRLGAGRQVPPLLFDDEEVAALVTGLRLVEQQLVDGTAARRALTKLQQVLPPRLRAQAGESYAGMEVIDAATDPRVPDRSLGILSAAAAAGRQVRFGYTDRHGRRSRRLVDAYRLLRLRGRWYLLGVDVHRDDWRVFRLDRITDVATAPGQSKPRTLPAESVAGYLDSDFGRRPVSGPT